MLSQDEAKKQVGYAAAAHVEDSMLLGLGTGSTVAFFLDALGERIKNEGLKVAGVPTSEATASKARALKIPLFDLAGDTTLDLAVDGADELDDHINLIKGGGGALLREKIVAAASRRFLVIADASKRVQNLGAFPLPVEIIRFGAEKTLSHIQAALAPLLPQFTLSLRHDSRGNIVVTDEGHFLIDVAAGLLPDPVAVQEALLPIPGVVEHGLFLGFSKEALLAGPMGVITLTRS